MSYMIIIFLLMNIGVGFTTQEQRAYMEGYVERGVVQDASLVRDNPQFPTDYRPHEPSGYVPLPSIPTPTPLVIVPIDAPSPIVGTTINRKKRP